MPEFYAEPMKDRKCCSVCQMTAKEKGKKVLLTCIKCHAITYCGVECQVADWDRHEWNCVPVMVTEIQGKGRGLVAARDIEMGELIFKDKPVLKLDVNAECYPTDPIFRTSLKEQIKSLPSEAKLQFDKLKTSDGNNIYNSRGRGNDKEVLYSFLLNSKVYDYKILNEGKVNGEYALLHLNTALLNHSCAPNAVSSGLKLVGDEDLIVELRAIKNISKGEEITICYFMDVKKYGSIPRKRKTTIKKEMGFDCKCPACSGQVPSQEKTMKKLIEMHSRLNPMPSDWKREAGLWSRIFDLTMELKIGHPLEKTSALESLAGFAHLARDKDLVKKAMDMLKKVSEEYKLEIVQRSLESGEICLAMWSREFSSNNPPKKKEIDFILKATQPEDFSLYA